MVAVALKEFALLYVLVVGVSLGRASFARFVAPSLVACAVFLAYAALLDAPWLHATMLRWLYDGIGAGEARFVGTGFEWLAFAVPQLGLAALGGVAIVRGGLGRALGSYVLLAIAASLVITTKEARWMAGVVPAGAFALLASGRTLVPAADGTVEDSRAPERPVGPDDLEVRGMAPHGVRGGVVEGRA